MFAQSTSIDIVNVISSGGVVGLLALIISTGMKRKWVWGYQLDESEKRNAALQQEKNEWKDMALAGTNLASRATAKLQNDVDARGEILDALKDALKPSGAPRRKKRR